MVVTVVVCMTVIMVMVAVQRQPRERLGDHRRVKVAALAGVHLDRGRAGRADAVGVVRGLLVALDDTQRQVRRAGLQRLDRRAQQRRLARAGAGDEVVGDDAVAGEVGAVGVGDALVGAEHVGFELDGARLAHAGHRDAGGAGAEVQVVARRRRDHRGGRVFMHRAGGAGGAAADDAHGEFLSWVQSSCTSRSTTRSSVPPVGCS